jgi:hypothetical protein
MHRIHGRNRGGPSPAIRWRVAGTRIGIILTTPIHVIIILRCCELVLMVLGRRTSARSSTTTGCLNLGIEGLVLSIQAGVAIAGVSCLRCSMLLLIKWPNGAGPRPLLLLLLLLLLGLLLLLFVLCWLWCKLLYHRRTAIDTG